ncbi:AAA family ATPase [Lysobacteraceae bacterium NML120232]|nr:AAA family ATPase [Xanthomonadaceae bacterium NML120232]
MSKRQPRSKGNTTEPHAIFVLWMVRALVPLNGQHKFFSRRGFENDTLANAIGLGHWVDSASDVFPLKEVQAELRTLHQQAEKQSAKATVPGIVRKNVEKLAKLVGLGDTDCRILEFVVLLHNDRLLEDATDYLGQIRSLRIAHILSFILNLPEPEIRASLNSQGALASSGLVCVNRHCSNTLRYKLDVLSSEFVELMTTSDIEPASLLRGTIAAAEPSQLTLADYSHIAPSLEILRHYLRQAFTTGRRGVNIFLHGAPGTGKSQLVRALADELGCELLEVASEDSDGDPVNGSGRLRAFRAAQCFLARQQVLIAFDEVEDVFNDGDNFFGRKSTAQLRKAWINRMLEDNPVPTIWLSNSIHGLDPAFIRRFDMVLELPVPDKKQRERILQKNCGDFIDASCISRIAEAEYLAPAVVAKASSVVRSIRDELGSGCTAAFEHLVNSTLEAQGHSPLVKNDPNRLPDIYDPTIIHADTDLASISSGLALERSARLCLYGPPGTGKTAYGRWLAEQLGMPLLTKRASDLMSMWVGENEQNIARAFREAKQDGAVLLIDEVDGFLQDRRGAQRGWEVSMVNEMLTQMESFSGVFIASTNLIDNLDQAALRRFDLKIKFGYLRPESAWELLCRHCKQINLEAPAPELKARAARLERLTPGDFAAVLRQHRFRPIQSAAAMLAALEAECAVKEGSRRPIGFIR